MKRSFFSLLFSLIGLSVWAGPVTQSDIQKLAVALYAVTNHYVDTVSSEKMVDNAIIGVLEKLDPHSIYISKSEVKKMNEPLEGSFEGIGVVFQMMEDTLLVIQTISGGPSEKVGIMAGDRFIMVNDSSIAGVKMQNTDIMKRLRGPKGTSVRVKVLRRGVKDLIEFKIVRDKIPIFSLDAAYMVDDEIGYIKINRFSSTTFAEYKAAFEKLKKKGMKSLILDLQDNGGGYMSAAIELADEFLSEGKMIVYTEGVNQLKETHESTAKGDFEMGNLVVLVNESSASASEIVSGAIQDWDDYEFPFPDFDPNYREKLLEMELDRDEKFIITTGTAIFSILRDARLISNALMDTIECPEVVAEFIDSIVEHEIKVIKSISGCGIDGWIIYDDLGTQISTFFSPETFREIFKPAYKKLADAVHEAGMAMFLHSC